MTLLFGGVPAAFLAGGLAAFNRTTRWGSGWSNLFFAGLVFQLSSVAFTAFLLILVMWAWWTSTADVKDVVAFGGPLVFALLCGAWGIRSWRAVAYCRQ
jgi:ABC-type glucose/galactose transport system permease subunit